MTSTSEKGTLIPQARKTSRRRRGNCSRKEPASTGSSADKENDNSIGYVRSSQAQQISSKSRSGQRRKRQDDFIVDDSNTLNLNDDKSKDQQHEVDDVYIRSFLIAQSRSEEASSKDDEDRNNNNNSIWNRYPCLTECILCASQNLAISSPNYQKKLNVNNHNEAIIFEDRSIELLNLFRKCIKIAASSSSNNKRVTVECKLSCLRIAIHGLRAICPQLTAVAGTTSRKKSSTTTSSPSWEAALKLLYHAVVTSSDIYLSKRYCDSKIKKDAALLCIAAYNALGQLLSGWSNILDENKRKQLTFKFITANHINDINIVDLLPTPKIERLEQQSQFDTAKTKESISIRQIFKIGIQSTMALTNILAQVPCILSEMMNDTVTISEFGVDLRDIVVKIVKSKNDSGKDAIDSCKVLMKVVILPWVSILVNTEKGDSTFEEALSIAKRSHRLLWDLASTLDKNKTSAGRQTTSISNENIILKLRMEAILMLVLHNDPKSPPSSFRSLLRDTHLEQACSYAWKTAALYVQQTQIKNSYHEEGEVLQEFHDVVGNALDSLAENVNTTMQFSYVEYCCYRVIHSSCNSNCELSLTTNESSGGFDFGYATITMFNLIHHAKEEIGFFLNSKSSTYQTRRNQCQSGSLYNNQEEVISNFCVGIFTEDKRALVQDFGMRCYKLLSLHSLNCLAYNFVKFVDTQRDNLIICNDILAACEFISRVMVECIGPLIVKLIDNNSSTSQSNHLVDIAIETFFRAATVFERLQSYQDTNSEIKSNTRVTFRGYSESADEAMKSLYTLTIDKLSSRENESALYVQQTKHFEKAAKMLAGIGRKRCERKELRQSLLPLVYSNDIFLMLSTLNDDRKGNETNYQLSSRFGHIASIYHSLGIYHSAITALLIGIAQGSVEWLSDKNNDVVDLFVVMKDIGRLTNGVIYHENATKSDSRGVLISRLVSILSESAKSNVSFGRSGCSKNLEVSAMSSSSLSKTLVKVATDSSGPIYQELQFSRLADLLQLTLCGSGSRNDFLNFDLNRVDIDRIYVFVMTLYYLGIEAQRLVASVAQEVNNPRKCNDVNTTSSIDNGGIQPLDLVLQEFEEILSIASAFVDDLCTESGEHVKTFLKAMIRMVASSSLIMPQNFLNNSISRLNGHRSKIGNKYLMTRSYELASLNVRDLREYQTPENEMQSLLFLILRISSTILSLELSEVLELQANSEDVIIDLLSLGSEAMNVVMKSRDEVNVDSEENLKYVEPILIRKLGRLESFLVKNGDKLHAAQAAMLSLRLLQNSTVEGNTWASATVGTFLLEGNLHSLSQHIADVIGTDLSSIDPCALVAGARSTEIEELAELELACISLRLQLYKGNGVGLRDVVGKIKLCLDGSFDRSSLVVQWVVSSCMIALSEALEIRGDSGSSLLYMRRCYEICQGALSCKTQSSTASLSGCGSYWVQAILSLPFRFADRRLGILKRIASAYARLGDYRRSASYMTSAAGLSGIATFTQKRSRVRLSDVMSSLCDLEIRSVEESGCFRLLLELKAIQSHPESVVQDIEAVRTSLLLDYSRRCCNDQNIHWDIEDICNNITLGDILFNGIDNECKRFYNTALEETEKLLSHYVTTDFISSVVPNHSLGTSSAFGSMSCQLKLRAVRLSMFNQNYTDWDLVTTTKAQELCLEISHSPFAPRECRAFSNYYLGLFELHQARQNGELFSLWKGHSVVCTESIETKCTCVTTLHRAKHHFKEALSIVGPSSQLLTRNIMRSLALVTGPTDTSSGVGLTASTLIHSSVGSTARQVIARAYASSDDGHESGANDTNSVLFDLFSAFDISFQDAARNEKIQEMFEVASKMFPPAWRFVAVTTCPTGEMLLTVAATSSDSANHPMFGTHTICIFAEQSQIHDDLLRPLDTLIRRSQDHLHGMDATTAAEKYSEESAKRIWWRERKEIDDQLQSLMEKAGSKYFGTECVKRLFFGDNANVTPWSINAENIFNSDSSGISCGNLAAKFEQACSVDNALPSRESAVTSVDTAAISKMTVAQLKEELLALEVEGKKIRRMRKADLVALLVSERNKQSSAATISDDDIGALMHRSCSLEEEPTANPSCLFLILDENLHRFPFEGMDLLSNLSVSRLPSLPFAVATMITTKSKQQDGEEVAVVFPPVDPIEASFIIDPEANLSMSKNRLVPVIDEMHLENNWKWRGVAGTVPPPEFVEQGLSKADGLFLYCGHGGGQSCFSRSQVESLLYSKIPGKTASAISRRRCLSTVILMGCSSGKLLSINRKGSKSDGNHPIFYEPEGIALSYLCAGAPCVVGNLWDVTDRDIDRYCITLLKKFLLSDNSDASLARCVSDARSVCKMRYIVGCAPVCYGVPTIYRQRRRQL